jgi:hypothetical protein
MMLAVLDWSDSWVAAYVVMKLEITSVRNADASSSVATMS